MNFKQFRDIGDSEPRGWKKPLGSRFGVEEDDDDEVPVPYCDEFDEFESDAESEPDVDIDSETETETESITSTKKLKFVASNILNEENDFKIE
jgi:hypothetical protein